MLHERENAMDTVFAEREARLLAEMRLHQQESPLPRVLYPERRQGCFSAFLRRVLLVVVFIAVAALACVQWLAMVAPEGLQWLAMSAQPIIDALPWWICSEAARITSCVCDTCASDVGNTNGTRGQQMTSYSTGMQPYVAVPTVKWHTPLFGFFAYAFLGH